MQISIAELSVRQTDPYNGKTHSTERLAPPRFEHCKLDSRTAYFSSNYPNKVGFLPSSDADGCSQSTTSRLRRLGKS